MVNPEKIKIVAEGEASMRYEKIIENLGIEARSLPAESHPDRNEDAILIDEEHKVFAIFDGLGGHFGGETAAKTAKNHVEEALKKIPDDISLSEMKTELIKSLREANEKISQLSERDPSLKGAATTATVVKLLDSGRDTKKAVIANVGDSRVYMLDIKNQLNQVTLDDNPVLDNIRDLAEAYKLQEKFNKITDLSDLELEELGLFKRRNEISKVLGMIFTQPKTYIIQIGRGEKLIITSDGIHDNLTDPEMAEILNTAATNEQAIDNLVNAARARSHEQHPRAKADDMSIVLIKLLN